MTLLLSPMLGMFNDDFIDHLFDLVEQTRGMHDETFNYSVIKLIVSATIPSQFFMFIKSCTVVIR